MNVVKKILDSFGCIQHKKNHPNLALNTSISPIKEHHNLTPVIAGRIIEQPMLGFAPAKSEHHSMIDFSKQTIPNTIPQ